jgi:hypothetical protein
VRAVSWFDAPAPPARLAVLRILVGAFATTYLAIRFPAFHALAGAPSRDLEPVGALWWLGAPVPGGLLTAALVVALATGAAFTAGVWFRVTGPCFALVLLALTTYRSSWGQLLWFENLMTLHVLIVACCPAADALSFTARRGPQRPDQAVYGWAVRLAGLVTVLTYVLAGVAKLRDGGWSWLAGDTLVNHVAYSAARLEVLGATPSPLAELLVRHEWLLGPAAALTIVLEIGAPLALLGGRVRDVWVAGVWLVHLGIAATMFVVFPYPLTLIAFAPLYRLERLVPRRFLPAGSAGSAGATRQATMSARRQPTMSRWWRRTSSG